MKPIKEFILENNEDKKYYIESYYFDDKFNHTTDIYDFLSKYLPTDRNTKIWAIHIMEGYSIEDCKDAAKIMNSNKKELDSFDDPQALITVYRVADGINVALIEYKKYNHPKQQKTVAYSLLLPNTIGEVLRSI